MTKIRVNAYVDGFNLYHAIDALRRPQLKWLDLDLLVRGHFIDPTRQVLNRVVYFSAYATWRPQSMERHQWYIRALRARSVEVVLGQFKNKDFSCRACGNQWVGHEEKETDVNIALRILDDAYQDHYDQAIIISQDSDLFPALRLVKNRFPGKVLRIITPPNMRHSKEMAALVGQNRLGQIKAIHLERSLLPATLNDPDDNLIRRPKEYD
jgi:hypothetical protein